MSLHVILDDVQVFNLINQEAFVPSIGVNVTGIRENHLQLNIDQEASVFISLGSSTQNEGEESDHKTALIPFIDGEDKVQQRSFLPNRISSEILLKQLFHEHVFVRAKNRSSSPNKSHLSIQPPKDGSNLLGHFCLSLAHRIFSSKVLVELEELVMTLVSFLFLLFLFLFCFLIINL